MDDSSETSRLIVVQADPTGIIIRSRDTDTHLDPFEPGIDVAIKLVWV